MEKKFNTTWLALTYNCNNSCKWCYANSNNIKEKQELDSKHEQGIIDLFQDLGVKRTILIGGEPTIYKNLFGLLNKFNSTNIDVGLVSNGRKLKDYSFARGLKEHGLKGISISFGSYCPEIHDELTGVKGSFNESISGLENARNAGINVSSNTVINKNNVNDLEKIIDVFGNKVNSMTWNFCGVCLSEDGNNNSILNPRETAKAFQRVYDYSEKRGIKTKLVTPMPLCVFDENYLKMFKEKGIVSGGPCQLSHGKNFVVEYNGNILPCTHFSGFPMMNIFKKNKVISGEEFLEEYLDHEKTPFKFRQIVSRLPSEKCDDSSCKEPCTGGCPLIWKIFKPEEVII